jgi:hypothetical protein
MAAAKREINEAEVLARMAGNSYQPKATNAPQIREPFMLGSNAPAKEEKKLPDEPLQAIEIRSGDGKKDHYEEKFLGRSIIGAYRGNVGISRDTLAIAERVIARIFDNKIAIGTYIDNILIDHFNKYKKDYERWLSEKPAALF